MVVANRQVDLEALKSRHPLGDVVEAAGVQLRGRGRVRQGVCPFHQESEGSFTVYADTSRFYCFGCGVGGDVLDFIQRAEGLTLPEAIQRLGGGTGLAPSPAVRSRTQAAPRRTAAPVVPERDPAALTAATRFYLRSMLQSSEAREYLASRGISFDTACRLGLGFAPGGRAAPVPWRRRIRRRADTGLGLVHRAGRAVRRDGGGSRPGLGTCPLAWGTGH